MFKESGPGSAARNLWMIAAVFALALTHGAAHAQDSIRIGVLNDQSGPFS
jgi:hypothetical protein